MNTPYPELVTDLTQRLADFAAWNAGINKSRREYLLHPFATCPHAGRCHRRLA